MIYLDNAATTWPKPPGVAEAVVRALRKYGANPGRGGHKMSMAASGEVYRCRETAAKMFHLDDTSRVVFTLNCTMALNMVLKGILSDGGRVTVSDLEHNAVMRPLTALSPAVPIYDVAHVVPGDDEATVENFRHAIVPSTRAIVCMHASNVFGTRLPIRRLGELAREKNLLFVVDGAQSGGVLPIDMQADQIDFLCLAGHKGLYGPMGTGLLLSSGRFQLPTILEGGTGTQSLLFEQPEELPDRLESGTVNVPGICGLQAGMEWVMNHGTAGICRQETDRMTLAHDMLTRIPGIELYTPRPREDLCAPVLSINVKGLHSEETAAALNRHGIAVRAGLHCAPTAHRVFGTVQTGTVRLATSAFTTRQEIEQTCRVLAQIAREGRSGSASKTI